MCGIAGIIDSHRMVDPRLLLDMAESLSHRGPDDERFVLFDSYKVRGGPFKREQQPVHKGNVGFAHRRLSIIDLSESASQPMSDEENQLWIIHNGEIFNYLEIREELTQKGHRFRTGSDTEVILKAYQEWGEDCQSRFNGMWAFVLYDLRKNLIFGSRDRFGIKPFFYFQEGERFSFASEIKALLKLPWISRDPYLPVIKDYLVYSRVDTSEFSFFEGIRHLRAGHCFVIRLNEGGHLTTRKWWDLKKSLPDKPEGGYEEYEQFRDLLLSAISLRLRSDVPVGTCLSGGLDSSAIVSLVNPLIRKGRQRTFSITQPGYRYDESNYIDEVIRRFDVVPKKMFIRGFHFLEDLDRVIESHDEPFSSTSMYAQWKVFEMARKSGVTVTLDGQGADELLAGYTYFKMVYWAELLGSLRISKYMKEIHADAQSLKGIISNVVFSLSGFFSHRRMIASAGLKDPQYKTHWVNRDIFNKISLPKNPVKKVFPSKLNQRLYEVFTYDGLPALLRYADRNSMSHSLESRMPFIDHRLVSFLFSTPPELKIRNGFSKHILRKALKDDIPEMILARRDKIGFMTHEASWFRNEMKGLISEILSSPSLRKRGYFHVDNLNRMFDKHTRGQIDASRPLWRAVNLELWHRKYID